MIIQRTWAALLGAGFLIAGVLRFVPLENVSGWETPEPIHGLLHLISGALFVWAGLTTGGSRAQAMNRWLGLFWLLVGVLGNLGVLELVEALAFRDNHVHLIAGVISVLVGWVGPFVEGVARRRA